MITGQRYNIAVVPILILISVLLKTLKFWFNFELSKTLKCVFSDSVFVNIKFKKINLKTRTLTDTYTKIMVTNVTPGSRIF